MDQAAERKKSETLHQDSIKYLDTREALVILRMLDTVFPSIVDFAHEHIEHIENVEQIRKIKGKDQFSKLNEALGIDSNSESETDELYQKILNQFPQLQILETLPNVDQIKEELIFILIRTIKADVRRKQRNEEGNIHTFAKDLIARIRTDRLIPDIAKLLLHPKSIEKILDTDNENDNNIDRRITLDRLDKELDREMLHTALSNVELVNRQQEIERWLLEIKDGGQNYFMTEEDRKIIDWVMKKHRRSDQIGGVYFYGPPGTGKSMGIVEANRREGFRTHIISVEQYTDFMRLIGERKHHLVGGSDRAAIDKISDFIAFLRTLPLEEFKSYIEGLDQNQQILVYLAPHSSQTLFSDNIQNTTDRTSIYEELRSEIIKTLNKKVLDIGLGVQQGLTEEQAWVDGEILAAIERGERPLLDEIDKGSLGGLDGVLGLLSSNAGTHIRIGDREIYIPNWVRIDATGNALTENAYLQDRFDSLLLDYPPTHDLLQKSLVWLTDREGNFMITESVQSQYFIFVQYIVPKIQRLYSFGNGEGKIAYPFTLRNLRKICESLRSGEPFSKILEDQILREGVLARDEIQRNELKAILKPYNDVFRDAGFTEQIEQLTQASSSKVKKNSNLLLQTMATLPKGRIDSIKLHKLDSQLKSELVTALEDKNNTKEEKSRSRILSGNLSLLIEKVNDEEDRFVISDGSRIVRVLNTQEPIESIISCSSDGLVIIFESKGNVKYFNVLNDNVINLTQNIGSIDFIRVSPDGDFSIISATTLDGHDVTYVCHTDGTLSEIKSNSEIQSFEISQRGNYVIFRTSDTDHLVYISTKNKSYPALSTENALPIYNPGSRWQLVGDSIVAHVDSDHAFLLV